MSHRYFASLSLLAAASLVQLSGQAPSSTAKAPASKTSKAAPKGSFVPPKTPWGDPDLQGIWPGNMGTPMQRPDNLKGRAELTDEEFAQRQETAKKQAAAD